MGWVERWLERSDERFLIPQTLPDVLQVKVQHKGKPFPNFTDGSMQRDLARLLGGVARATSEGGVSSSSTSS